MEEMSLCVGHLEQPWAAGRNKGEGAVGGKVGEVARPRNESFVGCRKDYGASLKYQMLKGFD